MDAKQPHRRPSLRLQGYDYTQAGFYYVTIVTQNRASFFGQIIDGIMYPNEMGRIAQREWERTSEIRPYIELGAFVIMPNHIHGILIFQKDGAFTVGATRRVAPTRTLPSGSLGSVIGQYKSIVAKQIDLLRGTQGVPIWQRGYYDHIIRNQDDLELTWLYIETNPGQWPEDEENTGR